MERFEERVDARFVQVDARFVQVDAKLAELQLGVAEIDRKLTALIAALNRTDDVEAALSGDVTGLRAPRSWDRQALVPALTGPHARPALRVQFEASGLRVLTASAR